MQRLHLLATAGLLAGAMNAIAGGYGGARLARWLPPALVRAVVLVVTATVTLLFFRRAMQFHPAVVSCSTR